MFCCVVSLSIFTSCAVHVFWRARRASQNKNNEYKFSAILHHKMSNKRFIIQHAKLVCSCANFLDIYLQGMCDRSMRSRTELVREIKPTDWSMAGNLSNWSSGVQIPRDICTCLKCYLYSAKCSWIINNNNNNSNNNNNNNNNYSNIQLNK